MQPREEEGTFIVAARQRCWYKTPRLLDADEEGFGNLRGLVPGRGGEGFAACSGASRYSPCSAAHEPCQRAWANHSTSLTLTWPGGDWP